MQLTTTLQLFLLLTTTTTTVLSLPTPSKRALQAQSYSQFQISDGTSGNALAEVNAKFSFGSDLASVSAADLSTLEAEREVAENAEIGTGGFDDEIAKASSGDAATALQNGKIKNKVLKLQMEILGLQIQQAQGKDTASKIAEESKKLDSNVALDGKAKGQKSVGVTGTFKG